MNVKLVVEQIVNVTAMSVVKVDSVSHFVDEMMIVGMVKCVKISFVQLDVVQMLIVRAIWHVLDKNV